MKNIQLLLWVCLSFVSANSFAAWDIYKAGLSVNGGYYDCQLDGLSPNFQHTNFGRYTSGGTIEINFAEVLTFKNGASNVCSATIRYRVYRTCDTPPAFSSLSLGFCCNFGASDCSGGACGPDVNNTGDQKWRGVPSSTLNLLSGLTASGLYVIEVYFEATGDDSGGCSNTKFSSNGGANFRAYFEYDVNDYFTDLNFSTPTWSGDASNFTIANNSTVSGLTGSEANRTHTAKLNVASGSGTQYISTQIATWDAQQEWYFWVGRDGVGGAPSDLDANNQQMIYLYANESNLESSTVDGYRILLGQTGTSFIRLQRIDNGVATTVFTSTNGIPTSLTDYGVSFKVTRSQLGLWTIFTSTLPTNSVNTQATPTPNSCPESLSTVNQGTVTDNTYAPASNGYFGFMAVHDNTAEGRAGAEFDSFRFRALPPNTYVAFSGSLSGSISEDALTASNYALAVDIVNASSTTATSVQITLTGDATRATGGPDPATPYSGGYTTQTLTWPAGTSGTKYVYIDPSNNSLCDDVAQLLFRLQNVSGGTNAFIADQDSAYLSVVDDDSGYETLIDQDFNSGSLAGWKTSGTSWSANSTSPIEGTHSARHSAQAVSGQSALAYPVDDANLVGITTTWSFEVAFANDASANNNFQIFLAANDSNLYSAGVDGYAVVIDQSSLPSAGTADFIRLYRVTDGAYASTPIINSSTDWIDQVNGGARVGVRVELNEEGTWSLSVDNNGGFNNLTSLGTGTDASGGAITFPIVQYFGVRFKYLAAASDLFRFDDITVQQSGCKRLWYSQSTGNTNAAIWAPTASGTPQAVVSGRYDRFQIQSGHNVTVVGTWMVNDISINAGATLTGSTGEIRVHGNWINEGTFTSGTSTVVFKGQSAQTIGFATGASQTSFFNLTIDNDGSNVSITPSLVSATGVVSMREGTLQTNGNLRLVSNSAGSGSIGEIKSGAAVSGNVELQRYMPPIPSSQGYWFNLSCPIQGQTVASWNDDIVTTGFTGSDFASYNFNNIQYYNESASGPQNTGYVGVTNVTNALENNRGYIVWLAGAAQNIDNTGLIQSGQITMPLSYTVTSPGTVFDYGWNLVGNPYPSEVDWNLVSASLTGPKVYYVYDFQSNSYKFRNATTNTGTASRYIAHSQGFLVKVNAAGQNLVFQETHKTNTGAAFERSEDASNAFVSLRWAKGNQSDESLIVFTEQAGSTYDDYDVADLQNPFAQAVEMWLQSADGALLAQDARPYSSEIEIPVSVKMPEAGVYSLTILDAQNLPLGACLTLEDVITGDRTTLTNGSTVQVEVAEPFEGVRFIIRSTPPAQMVVTGTSCHGVADASIDVEVPSSDWQVALESINGYEFMANGSVTFDHLMAGEYLLQVEHATCGASSEIIVVEQPAQVRAVVSGIEPVECNEGNSGMISFEVENANWFTYELRNTQDEVVRSANIEGATGLIEGLEAAVYELHVFTPCGHETLEIDLRDVMANALSVEQVVMENQGSAEVQLTATATQTGIITWNFSNGSQYVGSTIQIELPQNESLNYTVSCSGHCGATATGTVQGIVLGIEDLSTEQSVLFAQLSHSVQLLFKETKGINVNLAVYDAHGRLIDQSTFVAASGSLHEWSTEKLAAGMYSLVLHSDNQRIFTQKFIK
jgi:hypothetical protein